MARGSSYGGKPPEHPPITTATSRIPRRATRVMQALTSEEYEPETQITRQPVGGRGSLKSPMLPLPDVDEDEIESAYPPKAGRISRPTAARKTQDYPETQAGTKVGKTISGPLTPLSTALAPPRAHPLSDHHRWLKLLLISFGGVLIGAIVLITSALYLRGTNSPSYVNFDSSQTFPIQLGGSYNAFNLWNNSTGPIPARTALPTDPGPYSVLGKPTITAAFINEVLASYQSPTAGMGQDLYDLGVKYGIDPVYPLAFFMHESLFGTTGEARATLSLGNSRCIPDRPCVNTAGTPCQTGQSCYAKMYSWKDGFEQWYKLIRNLYIAQWGLVTVDQIIPKYAPNSDGNDEAEYIASLKHEITTWRAGIVRV